MSVYKMFLGLVLLGCLLHAGNPMLACPAGPAVDADGEIIWGLSRLQKEAARGVSAAQTRLAGMYEAGQGVERDYLKAAYWYEKAAEQGVLAAQVKLALWYREGKLVTRDFPKAVYWLTKAAKRGHTDSQYELGLELLKGGMLRANPRLGYSYMRNAAQKGHVTALAFMGLCHQTGRGTVKNFDAAVFWYRKAALKGLEPAQIELALMYLRGDEIARDYAEGRRYLEMAAKQDSPKAWYHLGRVYFNGLGVEKDLERGFKYFEKAANGGHVKARLAMGMAYYDGKGVEKNHHKAREICLEVAKRNNPLAQSLLGHLYRFSKEIGPDYVRAAYWYRKAAQQGEIDAQGGLCLLYAGGLGVRQDYVQAHKWCNLAASKGKARYRKFREVIERGMTKEQIAYAQHLAEKWRPITQKKPASASGIAEAIPGRRALRRVAVGTGFVVNTQGMLLTNYHVVKGAKKLTVAKGGQTLALVAKDPGNDLALLQLPKGVYKAARFRLGSRRVRQGESVVVVGFPLYTLLASTAQVTTGAVSALAGPGDDSRLLQITAPVQSGNSGGPVLGPSGAVIGVVVAKLNALGVAKVLGEIPQNVNFAINGAVARMFMETNNVQYLTSDSGKSREPQDIAAQALQYVFLIENWQ